MKSCLTISTAILALSIPTSWADVPIVGPVHAIQDGQSLGNWAAEWWQWAYSIPRDTNPVLDTTGAFCDERQVGNVWFLAGSFEPDPVARECSIPSGKALFFPLINRAYPAFLNEPPELRTEEYLRAQAACTEPVTDLSVVVDGFSIPNPERFYTGASGSQSPLFSIQLPPGNILDVDDETVLPELALSPVAEVGYYIFLQPLSVGEHTIEISATGCSTDFSQAVSYTLTVLPDTV